MTELRSILRATVPDAVESLKWGATLLRPPQPLLLPAAREDALGGDATQGWLILENGSTVIGLFQGMFEQNILTFNPGWDQSARPLATFTDVRDVQKALDVDGVGITTRADSEGTGPAHIVLSDPDGNLIVLDQRVDRVDA